MPHTTENMPHTTENMPHTTAVTTRRRRKGLQDLSRHCDTQHLYTQTQTQTQTHLGAKASPDRAELEADNTATDDSKVSRYLVKEQRTCGFYSRHIVRERASSSGFRNR